MKRCVAHVDLACTAVAVNAALPVGDRGYKPGSTNCARRDASAFEAGPERTYLPYADLEPLGVFSPSFRCARYTLASRVDVIWLFGCEGALPAHVGLEEKDFPTVIC